MILKNYEHPNEEELEATFREVYYFVQDFSFLGRVLILLILKIKGDSFLIKVARKMHQRTLGTLHEVSFGMHAEFFKRKKRERIKIKRESNRFVRAEVVE